ncbi:MAG: YIP1 family protein [bacterium]|nr:YIP1 family protein [bacterium]
MEDKPVCSQCQKPLLPSEQAAEGLCAECAATRQSYSTVAEETSSYVVRPTCGYHPEAEAIGVCTRCATFICDQCRVSYTDPVSGQSSPYCQDCYRKIEENSRYCAWEDKSIFFYTRYWITWKEIILHPFNFFDKLPLTPDKTSALTFGYLSFAHALVVGVMFFPLYSMFSSLPILMGGVLGLIAGSMILLIAVPITLFLSAASIHLGIWLQFKRRDFNQTFRIVGYGSAAQVLAAIPLINLGAVIITQIVIFSGLRRLHKLSIAQAILAMIFVPLLMVIAAASLIAIVGVRMGLW